MRRIDRAVIKQTIQRPDERHNLRSRGTKTGIMIADEAFEARAREEVLGLLAKYVTFKDHDQHYWIDRYWYFDAEKYQDDLRSFGLNVAMPVQEDIGRISKEK